MLHLPTLYSRTSCWPACLSRVPQHVRRIMTTDSARSLPLPRAPRCLPHYIPRFPHGASTTPTRHPAPICLLPTPCCALPLCHFYLDTFTPPARFATTAAPRACDLVPVRRFAYALVPDCPPFPPAPHTRLRIHIWQHWTAPGDAYTVVPGPTLLRTYAGFRCCPAQHAFRPLPRLHCAGLRHTGPRVVYRTFTTRCLPQRPRVWCRTTRLVCGFHLRSIVRQRCAHCSPDVF